MQRWTKLLLARCALFAGFLWLAKIAVTFVFGESASPAMRAARLHAPMVNAWSSKAAIQDKFTLVMATYKRSELLPKVLESYTSGRLPSLHAIIVVWQDTDTKPPEWLLAPTTTVPLHVRISPVNSMNERFRMDARVETQAIFMVDDDLQIQPTDLEWGFQIWRKMGQGKRIVGFSARDYSFEKGKGYQFTVMPHTEYSMVLSNAAFFDRSFFEWYWADSSARFREHVDQVFNCDDIAINFIVSAQTKQPPILLQPAAPVLSYPHDGLWLRKDHWPIRSACISNFARFSGGMPLIKTDWSISRDVKDHGRLIESLAAQKKEKAKDDGHGHKHDIAYEEEMDPDVDPEDGELDEIDDYVPEEDENDMGAIL